MCRFWNIHAGQALAVVGWLMFLGGCTVSFTHEGPGPDVGVDGRPDVSEIPDVLLPGEGGPDEAGSLDVAAISDAAVDTGCPPGTKLCDDSCVGDSNPATGCAGASCDPCAFAHADALCVNGACALGTCENQWGNCDLDPVTGCETDLNSNVNHCGGCGDPCSLPQATMTCEAGSCQFSICDDDYQSCDGNLLGTGCETNIGWDDQNCGSCGNVCHAGFDCNNTACRCSTSADCDTGGGGTCDSFYRLCECPTSYCYGPCQADGTGCL
jgi:hypothetical protein